MSEEMKPMFVEPAKAGRRNIIDKHGFNICEASGEYERDSIFKCITEHDTLTEQVKHLQHENKDLRNGLKVANGTNKKAKREAITELLALHEQDRAKVNSKCDTLINMSTLEKYLEGLK